MSDSSLDNSLENQFLIAMPQLMDSYFANSVTYLWKHSEEGALGIVINKPLQACVLDIFDELDIVCDLDEGKFHMEHVLAGGPVEGGPAEDDLAGVEDDGIIVEADAAAHCALGQLHRDFPLAQRQCAVVKTLGEEGWDDIASGLWIGGHPAAFEEITGRDAA